MRFEKLFTAVDSHTEGMPTRVITSGFGNIPGASMFEKKRFIEENLDHYRQLLMFEPRGHGSMSGSILLPPTDPQADLGIVFIEVSGCLPMCGHGTIGTVTVALETGYLPMTEPVTELVLDTPAGKVLATATVENGKVQKVRLQNVASFLYRKDIKVDVPGLGAVQLDIAYGGNFYGILSAEAIGLNLNRENAGRLVEAGMRIMAAVGQQVEIKHPTNPAINQIKHTILTGAGRVPGASSKAAVVIYPGTLDRSPCGTGTSARMAQLYGRGELELQQQFIHESFIGTTFTGKLIEKTRLGDIEAVIPTIEGRAWITGFNQYVLDPSDPFRAGFLIDRES